MNRNDSSFPGEEELIREWELSMDQEGYRPYSLSRKRRIPSVHTNTADTTLLTPPTTNTNTSASSENSSHSEIKQNLSEESVDKPTSENLQVAQNEANEKSSSTSNDPVSIILSDIHNEYTKRRYKHVESKVGQYIASIRAEDRKRRAAKFQRHSSMPTNLVASKTEDHVENEQKQKGYSINDLYKLNESASGYVDTDGMTSSAYSNSTHGGGAISSSTSRHESSDDAVNGTDFISKRNYAQLIEEKERLEAKLEEKLSECAQLEIRLEEKRIECLRHKRNVDYLRIELTDCQDTLRRFKTSSGSLNMRSTNDFLCYSYATKNGYTYDVLRETKGTQTDFVVSAVGLRTPKPLPKNESILRQRTNSNSSNQMLQVGVQSGQSNRRAYPANNADDSSYKSKARKVISSTSSSPDASPKSSPSPTGFTYYDRRYTQVPTINVSDVANSFNENSHHTEERTVNLRQKNRRQRSTSLRQRFIRFFDRCARCDDQNQSFDAYGQSNNNYDIEMMQSPTPLLTRANEFQQNAHK